MRVLITGGAGFIGSYLAERLLKDHHNVTVVDNFDAFYDRSTKLRNIEIASLSPSYRMVEADIRDMSSMQRLLSGDYDAIVHLAAKAGVRPSIAEPALYQDVNVAGTQNVLELAKLWGTKQFIFGSSSSVYGVNPTTPWREEDHILLPISPYASTKVSGELLGHVYSHLYGIRFIALRFFTVYGPRQRPDLAIHKFTRLLSEGTPIPLFGDGSTRRDYTFVQDIVAGIHAALFYTETGYEIFNIGNDCTVSLHELVTELEEQLGITAKRQYLPKQPGDVPLTHADIGKARAILNYNPQTSFQTGVARFLEWFQSETQAAVIIQSAKPTA